MNNKKKSGLEHLEDIGACVMLVLFVWSVPYAIAFAQCLELPR